MLRCVTSLPAAMALALLGNYVNIPFSTTCREKYRKYDYTFIFPNDVLLVLFSSSLNCCQKDPVHKNIQGFISPKFWVYNW